MSPRANRKRVIVLASRLECVPLVHPILSDPTYESFSDTIEVLIPALFDRSESLDKSGSFDRHYKDV